MVGRVLASLSSSITHQIAAHGVYATFALVAVDAVFPAASELVMVYAGAVAAGVATSQINLFGSGVDELARATEDVHVVAPDPVFVRGDHAALGRALANLVENARRYGRGRITVEATANGDLALLTVSDDGPGLHGDEAKYVFERFWRGRADVSGSGLRLAIVKATAERHGGRAYVEGARFAIELPRLRDISELADIPAREQQKGSP